MTRFMISLALVSILTLAVGLAGLGGTVIAAPLAAPTPTATPCTGDAFEPNDIPAQASALTINGPPDSHTLNRPGDPDLLRVQPTAGQVVEVRFGPMGNGLSGGNRLRVS